MRWTPWPIPFGQELRARCDDAWLPHRTLRDLHNPLRMNHLQEVRDFRHPFHSQFLSGLNQTLQGCLGRRWTVGGSVVMPSMVSRNFSFLFWGRFRTVPAYSLYGAVAAAIG